MQLAEMCKSLSGTKRADALDLLARSVRSKGAESAGSFVDVSSRLSLTRQEFERFADVADSSRRTAPALSTIGSGRRTHSWTGFVATGVRLVAIVLPAPALVITAISEFRRSDWEWLKHVPLAAMPLEGAIAIVALIATINVFTVQLSTQRLPGSVSRVAGQPWQLAGAYAAALSLLFATVYTPSPTPKTWACLQAILLLMSVGWMAGAMTRIFHRTDPAEACKSYVDRYIRAWIRASTKFGATQWRGARLWKDIESLPFTGTGTRHMMGHDVMQIHAPTRGMLMPSRRRARKILSNDIFADGGYIQFGSSFGLLVSAGDTTAYVRPPASRRLPVALANDLRRWLKPAEAGAIEDVSTQAVTLASLALTSAGGGDIRLGEAIAEQASRIVADHILRARSERARLRRKYNQDDDARFDATRADLYPLSPVLRDILSLIVSATKNADEGVGKAADVLFNRCLAASGPEEQTPMMFVSILAGADIRQYKVERLTTWLRRAGVTALSLGQRDAFGLVVGKLREMAREPAFELLSVRSLAALGAACVRLDPQQFGTAWSSISDWASTTTDSVEPVRLAMQVGAAGLESGSFAVAFSCAESIVDQGSLPVLQKLTDLDHVFGEATAAQLMDADLGHVPTDALERFRDYAAML
ncbi:hypothetical protein [Kribbella sp. ALI-6-A]|uniref:hypothetical protein n=1 Tax=Kribbella sp. ALI-6-A TaxID=1933817 RepID=UPI0011799909|nr:hypothetical protein [Kribbella sp. ALI-6-A]